MTGKQGEQILMASQIAAQITAQQVLQFWFTEIDPKLHFAKRVRFDDELRRRFLNIHGQASRGELWHWRSSARGRLAEIIVLDQFSRNIYRGRCESFAFDTLALALAQSAVALGVDQQLPPKQRCFLYMPFMHSELLLVHEEALALFADLGIDSQLRVEQRHKAIIERFGRYPHRNAILGRQSTAEELVFLQQPGSRF